MHPHAVCATAAQFPCAHTTLTPSYTPPYICNTHVDCAHARARSKRVILAAAQQVAKWTLPSFLCPENVGVANMGSRTLMVEARCARLQGCVLLWALALAPCFAIPTVAVPRC